MPTMFGSLLLLCMALASVDAQSPLVPDSVSHTTDESQNVTTFRSVSRLVNVSVAVLDSEGRPVRGLAKADFELFDNRRRESIANFSIRDKDANGSAGIQPLPSGEYTNDSRTWDLPGAVAILFDTVNTDYISQAYSLTKIRNFLRQLRPDDRVAIYVLREHGLRIVWDQSQPASALLKAINHYDEAYGSAGNDRGPAELDAFIAGREDHRPLSKCDPERFQTTLTAFQEIARSMIGSTGRKAIVWVTEHIPLPFIEENALDLARIKSCAMEDYNPALTLESTLRTLPGLDHRRTGVFSATGDSGLSDNDELDLLIRLLNQNDIALYPISAEGLQTVRLFGDGGMDSTSRVRANPGEIEGAVDSIANIQSHQHMAALARHTGGRAFYDRNDLETGIRRALEDVNYGYDLAYYPDHDRWNGDWRSIRIKVDRPAVAVLARGGYYALPRPKLLPPTARKQFLAEIAASPLEDTEIPVTVKMNPRSGIVSSIEAGIYSDPESLFRKQTDGTWKCDFEVLLFQLTLSNKIVDVTRQSVALSLTSTEYSEALKRGIKTIARIQPETSAELLYVIVHDNTSDAVGSVRIPLRKYSTSMQ